MKGCILHEENLTLVLTKGTFPMMMTVFLNILAIDGIHFSGIPLLSGLFCIFQVFFMSTLLPEKKPLYLGSDHPTKAKQKK